MTKLNADKPLLPRAQPTVPDYAHALIDSVDIGVVVYRAVDRGADFVIVDVNPACERMERIRRADVIGRRVTDAFPAVEGSGLLETLRRVARSGVTEHLPPSRYRDERDSGWRENRVYRLASGDVVAVYDDVSARIESERALERSEQRYRLLTESTLDGVWDWDIAADTLYLSPRWKAQLGYRDDELPNVLETWKARLHPDDQARVLAHLEQFMRHPEPVWLEEFRLQHKRGHYVWTMARGAAVIDRSGALTRILGVHVDISRRRSVEQALARRVEELRCLYEVHSSFHEDVDDRTFCERAAASLSAAMRQPQRARAAIELDGRCFCSDPRELTAGACISAPIHAGALARGRILAGYDGDDLAPCDDERALTGAVARAIGLWLEARATLDRLQLYERIMATTDDLMSYVDRGYVYRVVNAAYARIHGLRRDQIEGMRVDALMGQRTFEDLIRPELDRCFAGEDVNYQRTFDMNGVARHMDVNYRPHRDAGGRVTGAVVSVRDITELHHAEERLRDNEQRLTLALQAGHAGTYDVNLQTGDAIVNREYAEMLGYDPETFVESNAAWLARLHPDDHERVAAVFRDYVAGRRDDYRVEFRQRTASGEWLWILSVGAIIARDGAGEPLRMLGTHTDISQLKQAQDKVRQAAQVFSSTIEGVTITDLDGTILDVNDAFTAITGYSRDEAIGQNPRILQSGRHVPDFYRSMWRELLDTGHWRGEIWNRRKDGLIYPEVLTISRVVDEHQRPTGFVAVFSDITSSKQTEERLDFLAHHDPLTKLPNRLLFNARLDQSVRRAARERQKLAVAFIDLDRFKAINDSLGHAEGDSLLQQLAGRLREVVRGGDTIARISGDEFVALLENVGNAEHVALVVHKVMQVFDEPFVLGEHEVRMTCSIGVCLYPDDGKNASDLIRNADSAMYRAKQEGRNAYQFYTREMTEAAFEHMFLENALRSALRKAEFRLVYQPQVALPSGQFVGMEALLRWHHPEVGVVTPTRFIPIAEKSGLIKEIGAWVLEEACRQARAWLDRGLTFGRIAVNVSGGQVQHAGFADRVKALLEVYRLDAACLELEVTESFVVDHTEEGISQLRELHALGVSISIDDFGTGYSSLSYLKHLPVDKLKIDRSFVRDIPRDANDMAIAEAIIALAQALGLEVIAEGIETGEQAAFLHAKGCRIGQGFNYSPPVDAGQIEKLFDAEL